MRVPSRIQRSFVEWLADIIFVHHGDSRWAQRGFLEVLFLADQANALQFAQAALGGVCGPSVPFRQMFRWKLAWCSFAKDDEEHRQGGQADVLIEAALPKIVGQSYVPARGSLVFLTRAVLRE